MWLEDDVFIAARCPNIGKLLFLSRVHDQVIVASILAHNHTFVNIVTRTNKELSPVLQCE